MLVIILGIVVTITLAIFPVMLAAKMVGAERTRFGAVFVAVILQIVFSGIARNFISSYALAAVVVIVIGSAIYAYVLRTTVLKGFLISIISTIIAVIALIALTVVIQSMASMA